MNDDFVSVEIELDNEIMESLEHIANETGKSTGLIISDLVKEYNEHYISNMKTIICNDFSLDMLDEDCTVNIKKISLKEFRNIVNTDNIECCIGDKKIAESLGLEYNKKHISLNKYTRLIVAKPLNNVSNAKSSDLKFKFYELKYEGMWSYDWINKC